MKQDDLNLTSALHKAVADQPTSVSFEAVWDGSHTTPRKGKRKYVAAISTGIAAVVVPAAVYGASLAFSWGGERIDFANQSWGPYSEAAMPAFKSQQLTVHGVKTFDIQTSRRMVNFPIREPEVIDGWKRTVSEGYTTPFIHRTSTSVPGKSRIVSVTRSPLVYVDIYTNGRGQRIAVTQQRAKAETVALRQSKGLAKTHIEVSRAFGKDASVLHGFDPNGIAFAISGNWSDLPSHLPKAFRGQYENIVIFHRERNATVTQIVVDAYGKVDPSVLESFARAYLKASGSSQVPTSDESTS